MFGSIFFVASVLMVVGAYYKYKKGDFHAPLRGNTLHSSDLEDANGAGGGGNGNASSGGALHSDAYDGEIAASMPPNENSAIRLTATPDRSNWNSRDHVDSGAVTSASASSDDLAGPSTSQSYQDSAGAPAHSDAI